MIDENCSAEKLPSQNFVRECRIIVQIIGETLAAIKLSKATSWEQLFTDGTSRRQLSMQNAIVSIINEHKETDPIIVSSCIFLENETSEKQEEGLLEKINSLKKRLTRLQEVVLRDCPQHIDFIPTPKGISINKLGSGGAVVTDTCNSVQKLRHILVNRVGEGIHEMDCMHHLRNVWIGGMEKRLTTFLNTFLKDSLDNIDSFLRVSGSMMGLIRAFDKEFSLCANYPKGHGALFRKWMKQNHPEELLLHVTRSGGSCMDIFLEAAPAIYWNQQYCIEFLDEKL